jgi:hypothetical protein
VMIYGNSVSVFRSALLRRFVADSAIQSLFPSAEMARSMSLASQRVHSKRAKLGLLDEGVAEDFPGEVFGAAVHFLERLVDGLKFRRKKILAFAAPEKEAFWSTKKDPAI